MLLRLTLGLFVVAAAAVVDAQGGGTAAIDPLGLFVQADSREAAAATIDRIVASGVGFDEALERLRSGRVYPADVQRGSVVSSYRRGTTEFFYAAEVPESYTPQRKYQVRVQLHGGVGRVESSQAPRGSGGRLAGAEQIYVMPQAWRDAPWWSGVQTANLREILDRLKRTYNVDENRVVLSGVSDGGTGVYYTAMRETTPFASFLPLNGFIGVLKNEVAEREGDLFPHNLLNKPFFVVNGGRDPQYPTSMVDPYIEHMKGAGMQVAYHPQPNAAHDTSWWPELKEPFEAFVSAHPRNPLPDRLTWESGEVPSRAHWLIIDSLAPERAGGPVLPDLNRRRTPPALDFGIRSSGPKVNRVIRGSNAAQIGLEAGDVIVTINNQPASPATDVAEILRNFPNGRPLLLGVQRGDRQVRVTGRYAPSVLAGEADAMFPPQHASGRVELMRSGNRIEAQARGVAAFTLLLSPDQFDLTQPISVTVNGQSRFEGIVRPNLRTLLEWASRDNDRTLLFAAELKIELP